MSNLFPQPSSGTLRPPRFRPGREFVRSFRRNVRSGRPGFRTSGGACVRTVMRPFLRLRVFRAPPRRVPPHFLCRAVLPYSAVSRRTLPHLAVPHLPLPHSAAPRGSVAGNPLSESPFSQPRDSMRVSVIRITMRLLFG